MFNFRNWRLLSFRKVLFLPHILSTSEKVILIVLACITVGSGAWLLSIGYRAVTVPIPGVGKSYTEGILREPRFINPLYAATDTDRDISRLIYSRLLTYDGHGNLINDLADGYEVSQDGKTYTISLRTRAYWHDGKPVGADDVVFTIKTIQNSLYKSPLRANWQGVNIEKLDERTVRFTLRTPYAPFIENLAVSVLPKHLWESISPEQAPLHELNMKPIGSGPYKFRRLQQDADGSISWYELSRNADYYQEGPYLKTITFVFFKTEEELLAAWNRNRIDGFGAVPAGHVAELANSRSKIHTLTIPRIFGIFFNDKHAPALKEKAVREAIAHALNKKEIVSSVNISSIAVDSMMPPASPGYTSQVPTFEYNPEQARALLQKAGWKDANGDGILDRKRKEGKKEVVDSLRLTLATSDWPDFVKTAEAVRSALRQVGIEVMVDSKSFNQLESEVIRPRNFDMLLFGEVYGYEPDPFPFWHSSQIKDPGLNVALYANKKVDTLLEEARKIQSPSERARRYVDMQKVIVADIPAVFLYSQLYLYLLPSRIQGVDLSKISLPADRFSTINKWFISTRRVFK